MDDIAITKDRDFGLCMYAKTLEEGWVAGYCVLLHTVPEGVEIDLSKKYGWFTLFDLQFLRYWKKGDPNETYISEAV